MPSNSTIDSERLLEIENTITYQDQQIQDLSDMVSQQWKEIDRLKKHISNATERLENLENPTEGGAVPDEKPPHY
ncbi:MAG: SlyX family protein [Emcibacter sp.]|nr:SlyX family protein [Emcibacter sp.]